MATNNEVNKVCHSLYRMNIIFKNRILLLVTLQNSSNGEVFKLPSIG